MTEPVRDAPLISNRFLAALTAVIATLALLSLGISLFGKRIGEQWALADHSDSHDALDITIGIDRLRLAANTIRFEEQRQSGTSERVDLALLWPEMTGYTRENRRRFDDVSIAGTLVFLQLSQSTMSRDMSGRVEPIYAHLFEGATESGPHGLALHRFRHGTGYDDEVLLTAKRPGKPDYAVRCLLPTHDSAASSNDCQRDIHLGRDLTVLYRFSSTLLADWEKIDTAVETYVGSQIVTGPASRTPQKRANTARNNSL